MDDELPRLTPAETKMMFLCDSYAGPAGDSWEWATIQTYLWNGAPPALQWSAFMRCAVALVTKGLIDGHPSGDSGELTRLGQAWLAANRSKPGPGPKKTRLEEHFGSDLTAIQLHPRDVGFDVRAVKMAVRIPPDTTAAIYVDGHNQSWVVEGTRDEVIEVLRKEGYRILEKEEV